MGTATSGGTPGLADALRWLPGGLRSAGAHRARWGIVDQGISSFTNFAVTAVVAHQVAPAAFGGFGVALTLYICALWATRSLVGEPFVVRLTRAAREDQAEAAREGVGAAVAAGALAGLATVAVGLAIGGATGHTLVAMGLFLPFLLAQDAYRYVLMAMGRARAAAANDGLWLVVQTVITAALLATGRAGVTGLTSAFGAGAAAGAVLGAWQSGAVPNVGRSRRWLRSQSDLWRPFLLELVTVNATPQLSLLVVAALGDVVVVGRVRAGLFLFAPLSVLFSGVFLVALPEAVRLRARSVAGLRIFVLGVAAGLSALSLLWAAALSLIPGRVGRTLLRSNWPPGHQLVWPVAALTAASVTILAAMVGLRALGVARQTIRIRVWAGPVVLLSGVVGARLNGASGAVIGLALSSWLSAGLSWVMLQRALTEAAPQADAAVAPVPLVGGWA